MKKLKLLHTKKGVSNVEYGVLIGLISAASVGTVFGLGGEVSEAFFSSSEEIAENRAAAASGPGAGSDSGSSGPADPPGEPQPVSLVFDGSSVRVYVDIREPGAVIDWGDGQTTTLADDGFYLRNYGVSGLKNVEISGEIDNFKSTSNNLIIVNSFGTVGLTSLYQTFYRDNDIQSVAALPATVTSINYAFFDANGAMAGVENWDTSNITDMGGAFYSVDTFNQDLSGWDTSNVTVMSNMFDHDDAFTADLSGWCVSQIPSIPHSFGATNAIHPNWGAPC